jgi:hypothetical protein
MSRGFFWRFRGHLCTFRILFKKIVKNSNFLKKVSKIHKNMLYSTYTYRIKRKFISTGTELDGKEREHVRF